MLCSMSFVRSLALALATRSSSSACAAALFYADPQRGATGATRRRSPPELAELGGELRQRLEQIGDETVVGDLEDRSLLVLVDGDDHLRILHAGEVLDGAGNPDRDIELGRHDLA